MDHYQKILKKYYRSKKKNKKIKISRTKRKLIDKLFFRIFLSSLTLLLMVLFNRYNLFNFNDVISSNINFSVLTKQVNTLLDDTQTVSNEINFQLLNYTNEMNHFQSTFNGVYNISSGVVVKIEKEDELYNITILTTEDYEYTYKGLESINCYLYEYISEGKIIGTVSQNNNYMYLVSIYKDGKYYEYK